MSVKMAPGEDREGGNDLEGHFIRQSIHTVKDGESLKGCIQISFINV